MELRDHIAILVDKLQLKPEQVVAIGTDTEASICAAMRASTYDHFGCAMHRIDLSAKLLTKLDGV